MDGPQAEKREGERERDDKKKKKRETREGEREKSETHARAVSNIMHSQKARSTNSFSQWICKYKTRALAFEDPEKAVLGVFSFCVCEDVVCMMYAP